MPELPLISATVPGFTVRNWFGVAGPGGMPKPILDRWLVALQQVNADPVFQRRLAENGMESLIGDPAGFRSTIQEDRRRWGDVIRAANIRAD
jgi:tripartite-type tricarboxylate transporter receptor subunit TctC